MDFAGSCMSTSDQLHVSISQNDILRGGHWHRIRDEFRPVVRYQCGELVVEDLVPRGREVESVAAMSSCSQPTKSTGSASLARCRPRRSQSQSTGR